MNNTSQVNGILSFADRRFLMWAEPDEGSYNWKMYDVGSRYDREKPVIPKKIRDYVKKNASEHYPIVIIDGYRIDTMLDIRNEFTYAERADLD